MPNFEENPNGLREALESAVKSTAVTDENPAPAPAPAAPAPAPTSTPTEATGTPAPAVSAPAPYLAPAPADTSATPAPGVQPPAPIAQPAPGTQPTTPQPTSQELTPPPNPDGSNPYAKPPGTWTPAAREHWNQLPSEIKQEVWKREREASRALTVSAEARKLQQEFERTIQPYLGFIAAEQSTPLQAVNFMMQNAATLRVGTSEQKVALVADIIKRYGIDLPALDSVLAGQQPQYNPQAAVQQAVQQAVAPLYQQIQQNQWQQEQQINARVDQDLHQFVTAANPDGSLKHEFFQDVQDVMADLVEVASRRGYAMGLTEAYERAIMLHEPVRRVIEARKQRQFAQQQTSVASQAQGSAVSITPSAEVETARPAVGNSLRASIEAAINAQQGR